MALIFILKYFLDLVSLTMNFLIKKVKPKHGYRPLELFFNPKDDGIVIVFERKRRKHAKKKTTVRGSQKKDR